MYDSALMVLDKICLHVFKDCALAYFITDHFGKIIQYGGNFSDLKISISETKTHISDAVIFMEGILPLENDSMEFSCVKMPSGACIDAFLFELKKGYGLILWDASKKEALMTQTQQQYNELSLLIEKQKNCITKFSHSEPGEQNNIILEDFCAALNLAVFEMNDRGYFVLIGQPPSWIKNIPTLEQTFLEQAYGTDDFSFLGNFINEAKLKWNNNFTGSFNSGIWIEKDDKGEEFLFEANAININGKKLIIVAHDVCHPNETRSIIQKGRELALDYYDLKRSGQKLQIMHDELEQRVKERTKELEEANKKLAKELKQREEIEKQRQEVSRQLRQSQKMEAIGTLTGGIAHDFNNILSGIIGFTELSLLDAGNDPQLKHRLSKILQASERAKELIRQILTFSHASEYEKKPLKLKLIIKEALNLIRASIPSNIDIKKNLQSNGYILADLVQMHQVIMNLCTNAWHAMKEQGGTIFVELIETDVKPEDFKSGYKSISGRCLVLTIKDTGCGIPPDIIEKIFDPYFTTKQQGKGTGLGLSVVHGIIDKLNGCIMVKSQMGKGSTFTIYLPAFDVDNEAETTEAPLPFGNNEKILFVDDELFQTEMADLLLPKLKYRVLTCRDSTEALNIFLKDKEEFDLVITDMIMPKMSGKLLAEKIHAIRPDIPIIMCSGGIEDHDSDTIKYTGVKNFLMKPIGMKDLAYAIQNALLKG